MELFEQEDKGNKYKNFTNILAFLILTAGAITVFALDFNKVATVVTLIFLAVGFLTVTEI